MSISLGGGSVDLIVRNEDNCEAVIREFALQHGLEKEEYFGLLTHATEHFNTCS